MRLSGVVRRSVDSDLDALVPGRGGKDMMVRCCATSMTTGSSGCEGWRSEEARRGMGSLRSDDLVFGGEGDGDGVVASKVGEEGCRSVEFLRMRDMDGRLGLDLLTSTSCGNGNDCAICA